MRTLLAVVALMGCLTGCSTLANVSDDDLAKGIKSAAKSATKFGIATAIEKAPDKAVEVAADAKDAAEVIRLAVLPTFEGAETGDVLKASVAVVLDKLSEKIKPSILSAIQLAIDVLAARVNLPENPADKLDDRTKKALAAFFGGVAEGLDAGVSRDRDIGPPSLRWP